jgi:uncharacterized repeat protein (TIGR04052 family)
MPSFNPTFCFNKKRPQLGDLTPYLVLFMLILLTACSPVKSSLTVQLIWNGKPLSCNDALLGPWHLAQIQFYLSNFSLNEQAITLKTAPSLDTLSHQQQNLVLLGGDCQGDDNWTIHFDDTLEPGLISFELGVPFKLNHGHPLKALPPLNQSDMFWTWQQGHKFLRLDLNKIDHYQPKIDEKQVSEKPPSTSKQTGWQFHLGSIGCQSANVMRAPSQTCRYPNRVKVALAYQGEQTLLLDLAPLLAPVLNDAKLSQQSCMSDQHSLSCQPLFEALGINSRPEPDLTLNSLDNNQANDNKTNDDKSTNNKKMWRFN